MSNRRNLRLLHFLSTSSRAGVAEHALSLLAASADYGFTPYIAAPAQLLEALRSDLELHNVNRIALDMSSPLDRREMWRLRKFLKQEKIDLLHCHMAISSACAVPIARLSGIRAIVETTHGREIWREGKLLKGSYWPDRQIGRLINRFIAVSNAVADHLRDGKRIPSSKIMVIHNGRDLSLFRPATPDQQRAIRQGLALGNGPILLMVARFSSEKGHQLALDALLQLKDSHPDLTLLLAGDGPLESDCRAFCEARKLSGNVRFLGYQQNVLSLLQIADLVLLPSSIEGLPLVAIESLACECPVVATDVGGTSEIVQNELTGLLVEPGNPTAFALAIESLLSNPPLRHQLGHNGRQLVQGQFDLRQQIDKTMALYDELLLPRLNPQLLYRSVSAPTPK